MVEKPIDNFAEVENLTQVAVAYVFLLQTFSTPRYHPKSQPFVDHVFTFTIADNRIWFRNYQVIFLGHGVWPLCFFAE